MNIIGLYDIRLNKDNIHFMGIYFQGEHKKVFPNNLHYTLKVIKQIQRE